jgi:GcrA cell cycle regulator
MAWTDEKVELLKKLWANDLSQGEIAAKLGDVTAAAVAAKIHRLGLTMRRVAALKRLS